MEVETLSKPVVFSKINLILLAVSITSIGVLFGLNITGYNPFASPHYYLTAPDGMYLQKDWGWVNNVSFPSVGGWVNNATSWSFARCEHDYLGPLHGSFAIAENVSVPIWKDGVFPNDARLYITLKNNTIIDVSVHSQFEYGN
jgi:hypothetical protein